MNIKRLSNLFLACSVILAGASGFTSGSDETRNGKIKVAPKEESMAVCEINGDKYAVFEPEEVGGFTSEAEFEVTIEKKPEPHEEFIINEDKTEYKWESSTGLAVDKDGAKEKTCKISAKGKTQWGKEHSVKCTVTFYEKPDPQYKNNKEQEKKLVDLEEEHKAVTPLLLIKEISFNHDTKSGTKDALNLKKEFTDALPIQAPEYEADAQGNVTKNEPFLYVAGTTPTIKVALSIKPDILKKGKAKTKAEKPEEGTLPVDNLLGELKEQSFDLSASSKETEFTLDQPVDDALAKAPQNWTWRLTSLGDKALKTENITCTTKSKDSYIILDIPLDNPWDQQALSKQPWCQVLDFAIQNCNTTGGTKKDTVSILNWITNTLFHATPFAYDTKSGASNYATPISIKLHDYLNIIEKNQKIETNCYAQNNALTALGRLLGIPIQSLFHDRFGQLHPVHLVGIAGEVNNPFYGSLTNCPPSLRGIKNVPVKHADFRSRTGFGNHLYSFLPASSGTGIFDACGGATYNSSFPDYIKNVIEQSYPSPTFTLIPLNIH